MSSSTSSAALVPVIVPELDSPANPVQFVQWLVDPGATLHTGDRIAELLVAGVVFHLSAPVNGILKQATVRDHMLVSIGDVLGWIAATEET